MTSLREGNSGGEDGCGDFFRDEGVDVEVNVGVVVVVGLAGRVGSAEAWEVGVETYAPPSRPMAHNSSSVKLTV